MQCRYPRHFAAAALGVMMSATSAVAAETPPPPLCGQERKIQCYCGECSVVVTGDPLGGVEYTNLHITCGSEAKNTHLITHTRAAVADEREGRGEDVMHTCIYLYIFIIII